MVEVTEDNMGVSCKDSVASSAAIFLSQTDEASDETLLLPSVTDNSVPCRGVPDLMVPRLITYLSVLLLSEAAAVAAAAVVAVVVVVTEDPGKGY